MRKLLNGLCAVMFVFCLSLGTVGCAENQACCQTDGQKCPADCKKTCCTKDAKACKPECKKTCTAKPAEKK